MRTCRSCARSLAAFPGRFRIRAALPPAGEGVRYRQSVCRRRGNLRCHHGDDGSSGGEAEAVALAVIAFATVCDAAAAAATMRRPEVTTAGGMGGDLLRALRSAGQRAAGSELPGVGGPYPRRVEQAGGWLFCETSADTMDQAHGTAADLVAECLGTFRLPRHRRIGRHRVAESKALWKIASRRQESSPVSPTAAKLALLGDLAVPPEHLAAYLRDLYSLMDEHGLRGYRSGISARGCVHVRDSLPWAPTKAWRSSDPSSRLPRHRCPLRRIPFR